jgi:hypothetical protein
MSRHILIAMLLLASATSAADAQDAANPSDSTTASDAAKRQAQPAAKADEGADAKAKDEVKTLSGISILGNQEAPKALVIVPWKSSEIGDPLGLAENLDGARRPVDREVFMRELDYYDIRSGSE